MSGIEYGLGRFGDRRLEKGGPICTRLWLSVPARVFVASLAAGRARFNLHGSFATLR